MPENDNSIRCAGNSFLPRLWARRHLDALLAEGRTPAIKDEIVAMSVRYGIITPYTSFLIEEDDIPRAPDARGALR